MMVVFHRPRTHQMNLLAFSCQLCHRAKCRRVIFMDPELIAYDKEFRRYLMPGHDRRGITVPGILRDGDEAKNVSLRARHSLHPDRTIERGLTAEHHVPSALVQLSGKLAIANLACEPGEVFGQKAVLHIRNPIDRVRQGNR